MRLKAPQGVAGVGFEGKTYAVQKGAVEVPDHATVLLRPGWGFTLLPEAPQAGKPGPPEEESPAPAPAARAKK